MSDYDYDLSVHRPPKAIPVTPAERCAIAQRAAVNIRQLAELGDDLPPGMRSPYQPPTPTDPEVVIGWSVG